MDVYLNCLLGEHIVDFFLSLTFLGNYYYMTHSNDVVKRTAVLTVENATLANQGIYSASFVGDSPVNGAWMRLIVRGWLNLKFLMCSSN